MREKPLIYRSGKIIALVCILAFTLTVLGGCDGGSGPSLLESYDVAGEITDATEQPIAGVTVNFSGDSSGQEVTDSEGRWETSIQGRVTITPQKSGYRFEPANRTVSSSRSNLDFTGHLDDSFGNFYQDDYFRIEYPVNWQKTADDNILVLSPDSEAVLYIERDSYENNISQEDFILFITALEEGWEQDPEFDLQDSYSRVIGGQQGWEYVMESKASVFGAGGKPFISGNLDLSEDIVFALSSDELKMKVAVTYRGSHLFILIYGNTVGNYDNYIVDIDRVIDSFEFQYGQPPGDDDDPGDPGDDDPGDPGDDDDDPDGPDDEDDEIPEPDMDIPGEYEISRDIQKLYDNVRKVEPEEQKNIQSFSQQQGRLVFSERTGFVESLQPGDVIIADPDDDNKTPYGLIHHIENVSPDGLTFSLADATLEDVIEEGEINVSGSFDFAELVQGMVVAQDVRILDIDFGEQKIEFEREFSGDRGKVTGHIKMHSTLDFDKNIRYRIRLDYLKFILNTAIEIDVNYEASRESEKDETFDLFVLQGPPIAIFTGVWVNPRIAFRAGAKASIEGGASTGVTWSREYTGGLEYTRAGGFETIYSSAGAGFQIKPVTLAGSAEAQAFAGIALEGLIWGRAGFGIGVKGYTQAEGEVKLDHTQWAWEYDVSLGAKVLSKAQLELGRIAKLTYEGPEYDFYRLPLAYAASGRVIEEIETEGGETEEVGLAGVDISFEGSGAGGRELTTVTTNEEGFWYKDLMAGTVKVTPEKTGYGFDLKEINVDKARSDVNFKAIAELEFEDNNLEQAVREAIGKMEGDLNFSDVSDLEVLDASGRGIKSLEGIQHLQSLIVLNFSDNQISDISPLENLSSLLGLVIYENQIADISPLQNLTKLEYLNFVSNQVSEINALRNLTRLETLYFANNQVSDISPLKNLTSLKFFLAFDHNQVSDISALENLTNLEKLRFYSNQVSDISVLENLTKLEFLNFSDNQVSNISVLHNLTDLETLVFRDNQVSDISALQNLTKLERLNFRYNQVSNISVLANLTNLRSLDFSYNQVSDISALVANVGFGSDDRIVMIGNYLDLYYDEENNPSKDLQDLLILFDRGVTVIYSPQR